VKLFAEEGELYVLAKSEGRRVKERAMRRKKVARLLRKLRAMRHSCPRRDQLLLRIGAAKKEVGSAARFVAIQVPPEGEPVTRQSFHFQVDKPKLRKAEAQDGHYLLRSNLVGENPAVLWERYVQLTQIEAAFKTLKSELGIRPLYHQLGQRVEGHILIAFLAYCLWVTLKKRLQTLAPGLTLKAVCWPPSRCWTSGCRPRRASLGDAPLHAAGTRPDHFAAQPETVAAVATASANQSPID
jgi:Transposase DDE domain